MSLLKKDVNLGLLTIIIVLAVAIASIGIYYNQNYSDLSTDYNTKLDNLQKVTEDLTLHKSILNKTTADLLTKEQDETELSKRYAELRDEKEYLDAENTQLKSDLETKTQELVKTTNDLLDQKQEVAAQKTRIADLVKSETTLEARVRSLEAQVDACGGTE